MVDTVTTLIEKAISTDNDNEALACLRQVRKAYKGQGSVVMPRRPAPKSETIPVNTVKLSEYRAAQQAYNEERDRMTREINRLTGELDTIQNAQMREDIRNDEELDEAIKNMAGWTKKMGFLALMGWGFALVAVVFL